MCISDSFVMGWDLKIDDQGWQKEGVTGLKIHCDSISKSNRNEHYRAEKDIGNWIYGNSDIATLRNKKLFCGASVEF